MKNLIIFFLICTSFLLCACSQSGRRKPNVSGESKVVNRDNSSIKRWGNKTIVKMETIDGVNQIPVEINGIRMYFVFDTGAGLVSISRTEASFLYKQRKLTDDDVIGAANFIDANGDISEGTIINLKTVKVGDRTLTNIRASVVHNMKAPLLLGQTVLKEFGRISIDNNKGEITFE